MTAPRVLVTRSIPDPALELIEGLGQLDVRRQDRPLDPSELHAGIAGATAVICMLHDRIDAATLDAAGKELRCVANVAVGHDNIDLDAARDRGVVVTNTPGVLTNATAELALALMLDLSRRTSEGDRLIRSGRSWSWHLDFMLGHGLEGATLGIVGFGAIGQAVARRARAFDMRVVCSNRSEVPRAALDDLEVEQCSFGELLESADVVSLHCPLTSATYHLLDARALARMKPGAMLINTARGPIIDEDALVEALRAGQLGGAGLDVHEHEPDVHPDLVSREDVVLLPHLGSATVRTRTAMAELAARNVARVLTGATPLTPVAAR